MHTQSPRSLIYFDMLCIQSLLFVAFFSKQLDFEGESWEFCAQIGLALSRSFLLLHSTNSGYDDDDGSQNPEPNTQKRGSTCSLTNTLCIHYYTHENMIFP